jgi:hypothetical protein
MIGRSMASVADLGFVDTPLRICVVNLMNRIGFSIGFGGERDRS